MANRARPRCPKCETAMAPVYRAGGRGGIKRVADVFICSEHDILARGRRKVKFL